MNDTYRGLQFDVFAFDNRRATAWLWHADEPFLIHGVDAMSAEERRYTFGAEPRTLTKEEAQDLVAALARGDEEPYDALRPYGSVGVVA